MIFHGTTKMGFRILGVALQVPRQLGMVHGLPGQSLVPQQRQDRVIKGRGRELHLAALGQLFVQRHDFAQELHLLCQQPLLFALRPVATFVAELRQLRVALESQRMHPGEVRPADQVDQVPLVESLRRSRCGIDGQPALLVQLEVSAVGADVVVRVDHEEIVEQKVQVLLAQAIGRKLRDAQVRIFVPLFGVAGQLHQQAGNEIDGATELRRLLQELRHAPIIPRAVQADPGHRVFMADVVRIVGLVLMPENGQRDIVHDTPLVLAQCASKLNTFPLAASLARRLADRRTAPRKRGR